MLAVWLLLVVFIALMANRSCGGQKSRSNVTPQAQVTTEMLDARRPVSPADEPLPPPE